MPPAAQGSDELRQYWLTGSGGWCAPSRVHYEHLPAPMVAWILDLAMTPEDVAWLDRQWSLTTEGR